MVCAGSTLHKISENAGEYRSVHIYSYSCIFYAVKPFPVVLGISFYAPAKLVELIEQMNFYHYK